MDFHALLNTVSSAAGGLDLKSAAIGAVALKLAEPYLVKALVAGLPRAVTWFLQLAENNPAARQVLEDHRDDFEAAFDAMDAAAKKALPPAPAPSAPAAAAPPATPPAA